MVSRKKPGYAVPLVFYMTEKYTSLLFNLGLPRWPRLPRWLSDEEPTCQCRIHAFNPWVRKIPGEGNGYLLQYFCLENPWRGEPGELQFMGSQRVGYDLVTEHAYTHTHTFNLAAVFVCLIYNAGWMLTNIATDYRL